MLAAVPGQLLYPASPTVGINVLFALVERIQFSVLAYFQAGQVLKGSVRKGEHGTPIVFYKQLAEHAPAFHWRCYLSLEIIV